MIFPKLKRWWMNFLTSAKEKCTLGNLIDLSVMGVFALANAIMSASHPYVTIFTTSAAIGLSYAVDVMSNRTKINKLRKLKDLLDEETEETGNLEQKYPGMSKGKRLFLVASASCLGGYVIISFVGGTAPAFGVIAVIGASTIFHVAKKFYNSPLAKDIRVAENRLSEIARKRLPLVVEQEMQEQAIARLRSEKEELEKRHQDLMQSLAELQIQHTALSGEKRELQKQLDEYVKTMHELQESADDLGKQNTELTARLATFREENTQLRDRETGLNQRLETAMKSTDFLERTVVSKSEELSKLKEQYKQLQEKLRIEHEKTEILERNIQSLTQQYDRTNKEIEEGPRI